MKEALRHSITKTNMLNFLLVQTVLFMLCYAFTPLFLILTLKERIEACYHGHGGFQSTKHSCSYTLPFSPGQNRNVQYII